MKLNDWIRSMFLTYPVLLGTIFGINVKKVVCTVIVEDTSFTFNNAFGILI